MYLLNRTGAMYYFRRPVPKDLIGYLKTETGGARREWKISLGVTNREQAKRLLPPHVTETDQTIGEARVILQRGGTPLEPKMTLTLRQQEEAEAQAQIEAERQERHLARREVRTLLRQRMHLSTERLTPQEAAARDLVRERGQDVEELNRQIAFPQRVSNAVAGVRGTGDIGWFKLSARKPLPICGR